MRRDIVLELSAEMDRPLPRFEDLVTSGTHTPDELASIARRLLGIDLPEQFRFKMSTPR